MFSHSTAYSTGKPNVAHEPGRPTAFTFTNQPGAVQSPINNQHPRHRNNTNKNRQYNQNMPMRHVITSPHGPHRGPVRRQTTTAKRYPHVQMQQPTNRRTHTAKTLYHQHNQNMGATNINPPINIRLVASPKGRETNYKIKSKRKKGKSKKVKSSKETQHEGLPPSNPSMGRNRSKTLDHIQTIHINEPLWMNAPVNMPTNNHQQHVHMLPPPPPPPHPLNNTQIRNQWPPPQVMPHTATYSNRNVNPLCIQRRNSAGTVIIHTHRPTFGSDISSMSYGSETLADGSDTLASLYPNGIKECPLKSIGCVNRYDGNDLNQHYAEYQRKHLDYIIKHFDERLTEFEDDYLEKLNMIQEENRDLKDKMKQLNDTNEEMSRMLKSLMNNKKRHSRKMSKKKNEAFLLPDTVQREGVSNLKAYRPKSS